MRTNFYTAEYGNLGMKFIRNFNWIIDYKNKKVYYKKNMQNEDISHYKELSEYRVDEVDGKLTITVKKSDAVHNLKEIIYSVNGELITPQNICEYKKKLNETKDWDNLNVEIKR